jgi:hypothetical protein
MQKRIWGWFDGFQKMVCPVFCSAAKDATPDMSTKQTGILAMLAAFILLWILKGGVV